MQGDARMKALTLRGLKPELARIIEKRAQESRSSLSQAVISILEQATGLSGKRKQKRRDASRFSGAWTREEGRAFDRELAHQRRIDSELWK